MSTPDDNQLDGCELDFTDSPVSDDDIDGIVLFAGINTNDLEAVTHRQEELNQLFGEANA